MVTRAFICVIWLLVVVWESMCSFKRMMKHLFHSVIGVITAVANLKFDIINVIFICSYIFLLFSLLLVLFFSIFSITVIGLSVSFLLTIPFHSHCYQQPLSYHYQREHLNTRNITKVRATARFRTKVKSVR